MDKLIIIVSLFISLSSTLLSCSLILYGEKLLRCVIIVQTHGCVFKDIEGFFCQSKFSWKNLKIIFSPQEINKPQKLPQKSSLNH